LYAVSGVDARQRLLELGPQSRGEHLARLLRQPRHLVPDHADVGLARGQGREIRAAPLVTLTSPEVTAAS
jgi:hypothetical protein